MAYHHELLKQANHLAKREPRKPKQANLRRAISDAYYALFHFLIDQSARQHIGTSQQKAAQRHFLARAFNHEAMALASKSFAGGTLPDIHPTIVVTKELRAAADTFVTLQEARHRADYNLAAQFLRTDVLALIERVEQVFAQWPTIKETPGVELYLTDLLVRKMIGNRK
ncbi:MAG: hypothetical protein GC162_00095 [Planctomycetes bacterium]|nr:hypothetical protein [Planctomycetota bacterium]